MIGPSVTNDGYVPRGELRERGTSSSGSSATRWLQLVPGIQNRVRHGYERAQRSGREPDWDRFVDEVARAARDANDDEVGALLGLAVADHKSYRPAAAVARALASWLEHEPLREPSSAGLLALAGHRSPEVRLLVLEAMADVDQELAVEAARLLRDDGHPDVMAVVNAILSRR